MDGSGSWYVSWQGKVQGPLPWATLLELARLGRLTPQMLLSQDKHTWTPASRWSELFAPAPPSATPPRKPPSRPVIAAVPASVKGQASPLSRTRKPSSGAPVAILVVLALAAAGGIYAVWHRRTSGTSELPAFASSPGEGLSADEYQKQMAALRAQRDSELEAWKRNSRRALEESLDALKSAVMEGNSEDWDYYESIETVAKFASPERSGMGNLIGLLSRESMREKAKAVEDRWHKYRQGPEECERRCREKEESIRAARFVSVMREAREDEARHDIKAAHAAYVEALNLKPDPGAQAKRDSLAAMLEEQQRTATFESTIKEAKSLEARGDLNEALAKYEAALALKRDLDADASKTRLLQAIEFQKQQERATRLASLVAEGKKLEQNGSVEEALAKYEAALAIQPDPDAEAGKTRLLGLIQSKKDEEKAARFATLAAEGKKLEEAGSVDEALAKYDAALAIKDDPEIRTRREKVAEVVEARRKEANAAQRQAALVAQFAFLPGIENLPPHAANDLADLGALFLKSWEKRGTPTDDLDARKLDLAESDARLKALPADLRNHPSIQFLNGAHHFLVAMGIYDDFLNRRDALSSIKSKEALTKTVQPLYIKELATANERLKQCRERFPDHFATCVFESLSRAWNSDKSTSAGGNKALQAALVAKLKTTDFDKDLDKYCQDRPVFGRR